MPIGKNPDLRTDALKAAYDGIIQAKPRLDVRDPEQLKAWGALDGALLQLQTLAIHLKFRR